MKIAIEATPVKTGHRVRGVGRYTQSLFESLKKYDRTNEYLLADNQAQLDSADLVHYPFFHPHFLTLPAKYLRPTVVTVHDLIPLVFPRAYPPGLKGRARFFLQRQRLRSAQKIVTDSKSSTEDAKRFYRLTDSQVETVYLAVDDQFQPLGRRAGILNEVRKKYQLPKRFVLYVGDVNYNKNLPRLIGACWEAGLPLVIAGKQAARTDFDRAHPENRDLVWLRNRLDQNAFLPNGELSVQALGFVPDQELVALYNLADCYCQPSRYEGFGLPVLEAMSCGCPVVVAANSSLIEVVGKGGRLVEGEGVESLAQALQEVVGSDRLQRQLKMKGISQATKFSWKKTALKMKEIYEEVGQKEN